MIFYFIYIIFQGVAITQENSLLDNTARIEGWLARFPMFDWVGGRTSELSAVGLLPAALQVCCLCMQISVCPIFYSELCPYLYGIRISGN